MDIKKLNFPSYGTNSLNGTEKNKIDIKKNRFNLLQKRQSFCFLLFFLFFVVIFSLFFTSFLNFYYPYKYTCVFEEIQIKSKYELKSIRPLLPTIQIELIDKHFKLSHRFIPTNHSIENLESSHNIFLSYIKYFGSNYLLEEKHKKNEYLKIQQLNRFKPNEKIRFQIKRFKRSKNEQIDCYNVSLASNGLSKWRSNGDIETCFNLDENSWFGGHESYGQPYWPINTQNFDYVPYVTGFPDDWGAVVERYWLSSNGIAIFVEDDIPLLVKHIDPNQICLKSSTQSYPYIHTPVYSNKFEYKICKGADIKSVHMFMIENFLGKPLTKPDLLMMKLPVFTTWNYFFRDINQSIVLDYANQISQNNYSISQLEIDDKWELSYGDLDFDTKKFPNISEMVSKLHSMNMRITLWVHPFCNIDSYNFVSGVKSGYWVKDPSGVHPAFTSWWNGLDTVILDTTNPNAVEYFTNKLNNLRKSYQIDSFKFDAGETHWIARDFKFYNNKSLPDEYAQNYVKLAAEQSDFIEVRVAHQNQEIGVFYRILDRASDWTIHDGLKSVITETLQFGLLGYPFVLPDIIGGNDDPNKNNKELFIRWTQLTAFLPAMQFGVPPWYFDEETNKICKRFVDIHSEFVYPFISSLPLDGKPIIRPIWWLEPLNQITFNISDQFLVGDFILVAPVLEPAITNRFVYFPKGIWYDLENKQTIQGPANLSVSLKLETIPFYVEQSALLKFNLSANIF